MGLLLGGIGITGLYSFNTVLLVVPMIAMAILGKESKGKFFEAIVA